MDDHAANLGVIAIPVGLLLVAGEEDISVGAMVPFGAMTTACTYFVLFSRFGNRIFAMDGICSHKLVYLCNGLLMGGAVACPKHSANFDDRTAPACTNLKTWPVKMQDGAVHIEI